MSGAGIRWFYGAGSEQKGPLDRAQMMSLFQTGVIGPQTLVWSAEMSDWAPFAQSPLAADGWVRGGPAPPPFAPDQASAAANPDGFSWAVSKCLRNYVTFAGRAGRPEFWWFVLFAVLANIAAPILDAAVLGSGRVGGLSTLTSLALFLPQLAATARRLHDTDRSALWLLFGLLPLIGPITLLVFCCQSGTPGRNRFG